MRIFKNSEEAQLETLLQIMAVLVERLGGEVVVGREEFEVMEGVPVVASNISPDYVRFRLGGEDEFADIEESYLEDRPLDLPPDE